MKFETIHTVSLEIAGVGLQIACNQDDVVLGLQQRYRDFPLQSAPHMTVRIQLTGQERQSALLDQGIEFKDGDLFFTAPGYRGRIAADLKIGELELSSQHPVEDIDYFIRAAYALLVFDAGGMMLHAAGIVHKNQAYIFFGHSGAGKTTAAKVSINQVVLNDDLVFLLPQKKGWQVYGTPFWNPTQVLPSPHRAPLVGIYQLVQAPTVAIEALGPSEALAELVANIPIIPENHANTHLLLKRLLTLIEVIIPKKLLFLPNNSFWEVIA